MTGKRYDLSKFTNLGYSVTPINRREANLIQGVRKGSLLGMTRTAPPF